VSRGLLSLVAAVVALGALVAVGLGTLVTSDSGPVRSSLAQAAAEQFLGSYVDPDGRVVRRDQGGDTVSEGQAYAMLLATAAGQEEVFASVWGWTQDNLRRPDGLLSWQWRDGEVVDAESAADADLDAARALVLAGERFGREEWSRDGLRLGRDVLEHETVLTGAGRVLTAGTWVRDAPYEVNPSYASPAASAVLAKASGDPRWAELQAGNHQVNQALVKDGQLPPDWARVQRDGSIEVTGGPGGEPARFGYDAARVSLRYAESCDPQHRELAAQLTDELSSTTPARAVYDLAGSPQTTDTHPLADASKAAALAAAGEHTAAMQALDDADATLQATPTYYGAAWAALGRVMLTDDVLGGCPPLEQAA